MFVMTSSGAANVNACNDCAAMTGAGLSPPAIGTVYRNSADFQQSRQAWRRKFIFSDKFGGKSCSREQRRRTSQRIRR
jgi:hypothetical protein